MWARVSIFSSSWAKNKYQIHPRVIENGQKINSAKINKNIENEGEYSEMIKDTKMEHQMF